MEVDRATRLQLPPRASGSRASAGGGRGGGGPGGGGRGPGSGRGERRNEVSEPSGRPLGLNRPRGVRVQVRSGGVPAQVDSRRIEQVRESWLVEDRWWTDQPLRRRYWEVVDTGGRNLIVFHDLESGGWFAQR